MELVHSMKIVYIFLLNFLYVHTALSRSEFFIYQEEKQDKVYSIGVKAEIRVEGMMECVVQCKSFAGDNCTTASYNSNTRLCRLYNDQLEKNSPEKDQGWQAWSMFRGCGPPLKVPNADVVSGGDFLNAVTNYTCKSDFKPCGPQTESRCLINGEWTAITGLCSQYRWHYPVVRFEESLPCQDQNMTHIRIKATPTAETQMIFALTSGKDDLLVFKSRFNHDGYERQLALNTKINGRNGEEVIPRLSGFPFKVNEFFTMEITLSNGIYYIMVGDQTWTLRERSIGVTPKKFIASGDVKVELIEISGLAVNSESLKLNVKEKRKHEETDDYDGCQGTLCSMFQ